MSRRLPELRLFIMAASLAWCLTLGLPGCFDDLQHPSDPVADQIVPGAMHIGALLPLSDGTGLSERDAVLMAVEDANALGGLTFAAIVADSRPERLTGLSGIDTEVRRRLELLRRADAQAVVVADDATAVTARRAGDSRGPVVVSYAASSDAPFDLTRGAPSFRLGPPDEALAEAIAALSGRVAGGVAVLALQDDPYGVGLREAVEAALGRRGIYVVEGAWLDPLARGGQGDLVAPVLARSPGTIVPALPAGVAASVINEALPRSPEVAWVLPPSVVSPAFLDNVADLDALDGALAVAPAAGSGEAWSEFVAGFLARTGRAPAPYDALAYDAVRLVAAAANRWREAGGAGSPSGRDLARELPATAYSGAYTSWKLRLSGMADATHPLQVFRLDAATRSFFPESGGVGP